MADSAETRRSMEALVSQYKNHLKGWKEVLVHLHSMLIWSEAKDAPILVGAVTAIFLIVWIADASVLTSLSILGIIVTIADYAVPIVCSNLFDSSKWGPRQESTYESFCTELATLSLYVKAVWGQWQEIKETKPKLYSFLVLTTLLMMAYIGNHINNLLLLYLLTLGLIMLPGLRHHGILQQIVRQVCTGAKGLVEKVSKAKTH